MWQYMRRLSLTDRPMSLTFGKFYVQLTADGVVTSEVSDELAALFSKNPAFRYSAESKIEPVTQPEKVEEAQAIQDEAECDTMVKPKTSRKRASSRSRRKSTSDKQD